MLGSLILSGYEHDRDFPAFSRRADDASEADEPELCEGIVTEGGGARTDAEPQSAGMAGE